MRVDKLKQTFGRNSQNLIDNTVDKGFNGAIACLETFYYAFNQKDIVTFQKIWLNDKLIQLNNPLGGIIRGINPIVELYDRIFNGQASVWVELTDIVFYASQDMVAFAGREIGEFEISGQKIDLEIRTTRFFGFSENEKQWFQLHHHGSIDNVNLLNEYQNAVRK
ncbi:MAG: nuclear transport factor 2 family protein [Bacteroidota bacterium]